MASVKFCGLTRLEDAREAARIGAGYLGVIFAGGPRSQSAERAREILGDRGGNARRVGVFGAATPAEINRVAEVADLDIIQLHADPNPETVAAVRRGTARIVWAALRIRGTVIPDGAAELFDTADGIVLDARAEHALGGTGLTLPWDDLGACIAPLRRETLVLAGGLTPANVARAVRALSPDVVDVSSGVESSPGIKDHTLMRAFVEAIRMTPRAA